MQQKHCKSPPGALLLCLGPHAMLAGEELEDGRRLGELGRPLDVVRQVGKVQAKGELLLCPLLREVVPLLVKVNAIVDQEESDRLTQLKSLPVSIFFSAG